MRALMRLALLQGKRPGLIAGAGLAMVLATFASQMEMLSVRLLTPQSADAFELFAGEGSQGKLTFEGVKSRWAQLDSSGKGVIDRKLAEKYLAERRRLAPRSPLDRLGGWLHPERGLSRLIIALLMIGLFKVFAGFVLHFTTGQLQVRLSRDLSQRAFDHLQALSLSFHRDSQVGAMVSRIANDAGATAMAVNSLLFNYWQTPLLVISSLVYLYWLSPELFCLVALELPILGLFIFLISRRFKELAQRTLLQREKSSSLLVDFLSGLANIKLFALEEFASRRYRALNDEQARLELRELRYRVSLRPLVHFFCSAFFAGVIFWGIRVAQIELGDLIGYCGLIYLIYEQVKKIAEENAAIQRGAAAGERLLELLDAPVEICDAPDAIELPPFSEAIEFRNIWFRYRDDGPWVARELSLKLIKGRFYAIVGPNGAGKSSLVKLLGRLHEVNQGKIAIDGIDLRQVTQKSLRTQIAYVPQKSFFFRGTIAENIAFGLPIDSYEIERVSRQARAHTFIKTLPDGYDSLLDEGGKSLSGGQLQSLALARALARNAPILILDEVSSSLDAFAEAELRAALHQLRGDKTLIAISHRLSLVENADEIIYLDEGAIQSQGTPQKLLQTFQPFAQMWQAMKLTKQPGVAEGLEQ